MNTESKLKGKMTEKLYHNRFAPLYDYFQSGVKGDVNFYLDYFCDFQGEILEIGAGTGRITIPLLKKGLRVTALDISPEMLKILRKKAKAENLAVKTVCADMRKFNLRRRFDAIIVTFRTFQHLYAVSDQLRALNAIKKHLKQGGVLIFDVYNPQWKYISHGNWQWRRDRIIKTATGKIKIDYRNHYDMAEQMMYQEYCFAYPGGRKQFAPLRMRFFFRFEIEHLLCLVGFEIKNFYGDFERNEFKKDSPEMIWIVKQN